MTQDDQTIPGVPGATPGEPAALPAAEGSSAAPPPAPRSTALKAFLGGLAGGVVVTLLAGAGLAAAWPSLHDLLLADEDRRLTQAEHAVDDITPRLTALEREQARNAGTPDLAATVQSLNQRLAALEGQTHGPAADPRVGTLAEQSDRMAADINRLDGETQALRRAIPPEGTILRLADRAEAAERQAREIASQHASAQALLLVVGQLREAVDRGDPFAAELQAARRVAPPDDTAMLESLAADAPRGISRKDDLIAAFPRLADAMVDAATAPTAPGFWQRGWAKLASLVRIRRIDGQGDSPSAVVARAEAALKARDLNQTADQLGTLTGRPAEIAQPWVASLKARLAADRVLSELTASAAAQTAKLGGM